MWALTILALLFSIAPRTWALTEFEYLNVAHNFVQQFIAPQNELQVQAVNSSLFSDDVKGTVDGQSLLATYESQLLTLLVTTKWERLLTLDKN